MINMLTPKALIRHLTIVFIRKHKVELRKAVNADTVRIAQLLAGKIKVEKT